MAIFEGRFTDTGGLRIAVVVARFNDLVTGKLLSGCLDCLFRHGIDIGSSDGSSSAQLDVAWVPGSYEIPLVAQRLAASGRYQVVITLGAVIRGDTPHFDVVVAEVSKGVAAVSRATLQQALERAGIKSNLGWNYALQALEMGSLMAALPA